MRAMTRPAAAPSSSPEALAGLRCAALWAGAALAAAFRTAYASWPARDHNYDVFAYARTAERATCRACLFFPHHVLYPSAGRARRAGSAAARHRHQADRKSVV